MNNTIQITLTKSQAEELYYAVSHSCADALYFDHHDQYKALKSLKESLQAQGLDIIMH